MTGRMPAPWSRWLGGLLLVVAVAPAPAQPGGTSSTDGPLRRVWTNASERHQPAPVPPHLEIEILDPNVDPRGNPAVKLQSRIACTRTGPEERFVVDIPEVVLVHRYYYTGDRTFQGPFLPGGPSIVVLNHPKTAERLYIPVQMLPGAPRVTYRSHSIEYDYGTQRVCIVFGLLGKPTVSHQHGVPFTTRLRQTTDHARDSARRLLDRTDLPRYSDEAYETTKGAVLTGIDGLNRLGKIALAPVAQVGQLLPFAKTMSTTPERLAERERDATLRRADGLRERSEELFLRSNR